MFSDFEEAVEVFLGSEVGGGFSGGGDFAISGDGEVEDDFELGAEGLDDAKGFPAGSDIVDAKEVGTCHDAVGEESDGAGVTVARIGKVEDVADDGLP